MATISKVKKKITKKKVATKPVSAKKAAAPKKKAARTRSKVSAETKSKITKATTASKSTTPAKPTSTGRAARMEAWHNRIKAAQGDKAALQAGKKAATQAGKTALKRIAGRILPVMGAGLAGYELGDALGAGKIGKKLGKWVYERTNSKKSPPEISKASSNRQAQRNVASRKKPSAIEKKVETKSAAPKKVASVKKPAVNKTKVTVVKKQEPSRGYSASSGGKFSESQRSAVEKERATIRDEESKRKNKVSEETIKSVKRYLSKK